MPAALEIERLRFAYGSGPEGFALVVERFELAPGEQVLLAGPSGSGKSTLLALIAGLLEPASGSIRVGGDSISAMQGAARDLFRGRRIGMIFQTFNLLHGFSARENVEVALLATNAPRSEQRTRAEALLGELGIERIDALVDELSVGQQQRVAVARAVACRPALVLADEPTASLDPPTAQAAMETIQRCCREAGAALLCTSHDPQMRERFRRVESIDAFLNGRAGHAPATPVASGSVPSRGDHA
ncbi:MAG: ABC transporter ATP-binding protein [Phycisphaeraceae bacterium]|nr:ABC transporter ATP-binding protein [Phycisphaeraceae bacterium]